VHDGVGVSVGVDGCHVSPRHVAGYSSVPP
jgi:hypothetical protein